MGTRRNNELLGMYCLLHVTHFTGNDQKLPKKIFISPCMLIILIDSIGHCGAFSSSFLKCHIIKARLFCGSIWGLIFHLSADHLHQRHHLLLHSAFPCNPTKSHQTLSSAAFGSVYLLIEPGIVWVGFGQGSILALHGDPRDWICGPRYAKWSLNPSPFLKTLCPAGKT